VPYSLKPAFAGEFLLLIYDVYLKKYKKYKMLSFILKNRGK
jgi:hypothetical protein